jgi:hypothetical protein
VISDHTPAAPFPSKIRDVKMGLALPLGQVLSLVNNCFRAAFPALLAADMVRKKIGDHPIGLDPPAR